jgi:ATP-dependent 26S proteasome regulatory subunit
MNTKEAIEKLDRYIRARYPLITIVSHEEKRVMSAIKALAMRRGRAVAEWAVTTGLVGVDTIDPEDTRDIIAMLMAICNVVLDRPTLFIIKDFHGLMNDPVTVRLMRDVAGALEKTPHNVVFLSPQFDTPFDLQKVMVLIDWPLPDASELEATLDRVAGNMPEKYPVNLNGAREAVVKSLLGLTAFEAESVLLSGVAAEGALNEGVIQHIVKEKAQIVRRSGTLEFYDTSLTMADVGGLGNLKQYANTKLATFSEKAREFGLDPARGVLLVGVPGTGKSLTAKAIAGGRFPLLRLDVGALMGSLVGQSEANMRNALKVAEAIAPCILWLDEIEKALGGINGGESDGGTTKRVFGTFLTWMSEKTAPVYIIATANDIRSLPAELFRAGRFDDIYFVDLPNNEDRAAILDVHLRKRGRSYTAEFAPVIAKTWGMTGAEIEKVVTTALEYAFMADRDITVSDLIQATQAVNPIAKTMKDQIDTLRGWARTRAHWAGAPLEAAPDGEGQRMIE